MSRFAQTYEDPSYEYIGEDIMEEVVEYNEAQGHRVFEAMVVDLSKAPLAA